MRKGFFAVSLLLVLVLLVGSGCANKWVTSGKIAMNSKNYDKAILDFNKALKENPANAEAHMFIAACYKEKEEYDKMPYHLDEAGKLESQAKKVQTLRSEAWLDLFDSGRDKAKTEDYVGSQNDFIIAVKIDPSRYEAYSNLGFVWQNLDNIDSSYYYYSEAYKIAPDEMSVIENLARICVVNSNYDQAGELYNKLLEKEPNNAEAYQMLGDFEVQKGDNVKAVEYYEKALELEKSNCDLWFNVGLVYFQDLKDDNRAIEAFNHVLEYCPDDINANINLAVALINSEKFDEAIAILEPFLEIHPDECSGWDLYMRALLQSGKRNEALDANEKFEECKNSK